ncbi:MAG: hypothetical protein WCF20_13245 [Methylovirgula sp.]
MGSVSVALVPYIDRSRVHVGFFWRDGGKVVVHGQRVDPADAQDECAAFCGG